MKAVIVCNGTISDYEHMKKYFEGAGLVICADGGARHLRRFGLIPDILLGDFDSISETDLRFFKDKGVEIASYPAKKDMTDTEIAVELALGKDCSTLTILGGVGTRLDHSLSNVLLLKKMLACGVNGLIADEYNEIVLIRDSIRLERENNARVTLLPLSQKVCGVTTKGLYFPLENATLEMGSTWGVSNEFSAEAAEVTVKEGLLLVIKSREA